MNKPISPTKAATCTMLIEDGGNTIEGHRAGSVRLSKKIPWRDILIGTLVFVVSFFLYTQWGRKLAEGNYLDYYNLAFDFDPYLYLSTLALETADKVGFKHPLIIAARPIGQSLLALGMSPEGAAVFTMCLFGALTNVVVWVFLRCQSVDRSAAVLLTVLFSLTSTTVITAIVPESYGISNFAIALTWLLALLCMRTGMRNRIALWRYFSALILVGTTITNAVQFAIAEFCAHWHRATVREAITSSIRTAWKFAALFILAAFIVWHQEILSAVQDPVRAVKRIYWLRTKGERTGLLEVLRSFFAYSFVAPAFTTVDLTHDAAAGIYTRMWDFRDWRFSAYGLPAVWIWLGGVVAGSCLAFKGNDRKLYLGIASALLFNIVFHMDFQFRGSLYLYAAHVHFLVFALFARTAVLHAGSVLQRTAYLGALAGLIVLVAANNIPLVEQFANGFVTPATTCRAPCS